MMESLRDCIAPAKLNLFLHVVGRRADGYHLLQSVFTLIDLQDRLHFTLRSDQRIERSIGPAGVAPEDDLSVRAARLLRTRTPQGMTPGVDIAVEKSIPMGGGLGGGSSDAATTLIALNRLWKLNLHRKELMALGLQLGADIPFFIFGQNAWVEGIGEQLRPLALPALWFAVIHPGVSVPTAAIFGAAELTRDTKPIKISDFSAGVNSAGDEFKLLGHNDLESVATARFPAVGEAVRRLQPHGAARMSGSGACVFCPFTTREGAEKALQDLPKGWTGWVCRSMNQHPLHDWAAD